MSHYTCLVLVPKDTPPADVENRVSELLAPYDENLEVPEYDRECYCVGRKAEGAAMEAANEVETMERIRARFQQAHAKRTEEQLALDRLNRKLTSEEKKQYNAIETFLKTKWAEAIEPWQQRMAAALDANPLKGKPDPRCEECHGKGTKRSVYNPKSKWDWFQIGGRWNGYLRQFAKTPLGPQRVKDRADGLGVQGDLKDNAFRLADLDTENEDFGVFSILAPDGEWHAEGRMGWWAIVSNEDQGWERKQRELLAKHADCIGVLVDLHI